MESRDVIPRPITRRPLVDPEELDDPGAPRALAERDEPEAPLALLPLLPPLPLLLEPLPLALRAPLLELPFPLLAPVPPLLRFGMLILGIEGVHQRAHAACRADQATLAGVACGPLASVALRTSNC